MTSGLKGNHRVITLEASLKSELQNQFSFLLLPEPYSDHNPSLGTEAQRRQQFHGTFLLDQCLKLRISTAGGES